MRRWSALYVFGDSYSDSGAGYVDGNGPTAVVYLAESLSIPFTHATAPDVAGRSLNFAVSGAQTGKCEGFIVRPATLPCGCGEALLGRGMQTQIQDFSQRVKSGLVRFDPCTTLFFLAGGLNDHSLSTEASVTNLGDAVKALDAVGGRYFLIALLPTKIPAFRAVGSRLNSALAELLEGLRGSVPGIRIDLSRWGEYFDRIIERPTAYGILNTTDRCAGRAIFGEDPTPCASPDKFFYYHDGHPSTAVHRIVGAELKQEVLRVFCRQSGDARADDCLSGGDCRSPLHQGWGDPPP